MQTQLSNGQGLKRSLTVTVPAATVAERLESRYQSLAKTVKIDGFRPGKVPPKVVKERLSSQVQADVARALVQEFLPKAVQEQKLNVAGQPQVRLQGIEAKDSTEENFKVPASGDFAFIAEVEVYPEFEPKGFEKLKLTKDVAEADEDLVATALKRLEGQLQSFEDKTGKAAKNDRVTVTGQGFTTQGGKEEAFPGGNLQNFKIVLGSGQLIPGFEEALEGVKKGDEIEVKVTFPKDYHAAALAGQPAVFKLKVEGIEAPSEAGLTDESVKPLGFKTLMELKDVLKNGAVRDLTTASEQRLKRQLLDKLDEANKFDLPESLVQAEHAALWRAQLQELQQRRLPMEALGKSPEEAIAELKPLAERRVRLGLVLAELAKRHNLQVQPDEIEQAVQAQVQAAGPQGPQVRQYFATPANRQQLAGPILEDKVTAWLLSKAEVTEKKVTPTQLLSEIQG